MKLRVAAQDILSLLRVIIGIYNTYRRIHGTSKYLLIIFVIVCEETVNTKSSLKVLVAEISVRSVKFLSSWRRFTTCNASSTGIEVNNEMTSQEIVVSSSDTFANNHRSHSEISFSP